MKFSLIKNDWVTFVKQAIAMWNYITEHNAVLSCALKYDVLKSQTIQLKESTWIYFAITFFYYYENTLKIFMQYNWKAK